MSMFKSTSVGGGGGGGEGDYDRLLNETSSSSSEAAAAPNRWTMDGIRSDARVLQERLLRMQALNQLLENRTDLFYVGGFATAHLVCFVFAHYLWVTANFRRPFVVTNAALAVAGAVAVAWFSWLAPRWFRRSVEQRTQIDDVAEQARHSGTAAAAAAAINAAEQARTVQFALPPRGSTDMNGLVGVAFLVSVLFVLVDFAARHVRDIVGHGRMAWLGIMLPVIIGADYTRHRFALYVAAKTASSSMSDAQDISQQYVARFPATQSADVGLPPSPPSSSAPPPSSMPKVIVRPWLGGGCVRLDDWRVVSSLLFVESAVLLTCMTFDSFSTTGRTSFGALFGFALGACLLLGAIMLVSERLFVGMRSSNVVCFVAFSAALLLATFTAALDRGSAHSDTEPSAVHRFEHAGLVTVYLLIGGLLLYVYAVLALIVTRRLGAVHTTLLMTVSLCVSCIVVLLLSGRVEYVSWTAVFGIIALLIASASYVYSSIAAQLKPVEYAHVYRGAQQ